MTSIVCTHLSGYGSSQGNQKYLPQYADAFKNAGEMRFFGGISNSREVGKLVDIRIQDNGSFDLVVYPHNDKDLFAWACTPEIRASVELMMGLLIKKYPERKVFTVDLETFTEIAMEDFNHWRPSCLENKKGYSAFIFIDAVKEEMKFPHIFLIEYRDTEDFRKVLPIQVWSSRWLYPTTEKATEFGKYLSYLLINSQLSGEFKGVSPRLNSLEFPTKAQTENIIIQTTELEELARNSGAQNIRRVGSKFVDTNEDKDIIIIPKEDDNPFGPPETTGVDDVISEEIINKGTIHLSNMIAYGLPETIKLIGRAERPIEVVIDVAGYAKKMCVFEGFVYAVPTPGQEVPLSEDLGVYYVECSMESIPLLLHKTSLLN